MSVAAPTASVVIPTRNRARLLERALRSVVAQTFQDFEIIVVDDASDEDPASLVEGLNDPRIHLVRQPSSRGGGAARNAGIALSRGQFIAFLDDDDEWLPTKLQRQVALLQQEPDVGMVYTGYDYVDGLAGEVFQTFVPRRRGQLYEALLADNIIGTTSSAMVRRDALQRAGGFDPDLRSGQDWDLWLRIAHNERIDFLPEPLLRFYVHRVRITHDLGAKIQGRERFLEKNFADISRDARVLSNHYAYLGQLYCHQGDLQAGRQYLLKALRKNPFSAYACKYLLPSLLGANGYRLILQLKRSLVRPPGVRNQD